MEAQPQPSMRRTPPGGPPAAISLAEYEPEDRQRLFAYLRQLAHAAIAKFRDQNDK